MGERVCSETDEGADGRSVGDGSALAEATLPVLGDVLLDRASWRQRALDAEARERALIAEVRRLRATFGVVRVGSGT